MPAPNPTIELGLYRDRIMAEVCRYYDVTPSELRGPRRIQHIAHARFTLYFLLHEDVKMGWSAIGRYLNKDHSTILCGCPKANVHSVEAIRGKIAAGARS